MLDKQIKGYRYEKLILEKVKYEFDDNFRYELNYRVEGIISKTVREFDIAIFRENEKFPFWIIECKNWDEKYIKEKLIKKVSS